jgi:ankyrin repeat protein
MSDPTEAAAAIRAADVDALARLLRATPDLATALVTTRRGGRTESRTLLHVATDWPGHYPHVAASIAVLIAAGADVDARFTGPHNETPLHWAASSNDVDALDALLDAGADIEAPGAVIAGGTPLDDAVAFAQWQAARRLVERGAHTNLFNAAGLGLINRVRDHLAADPPAELIDSALWVACHGGQQPSAELLLTHGADLNRPAPWEPLTPLDAARREGFHDLAAWLTTQGARSAADLPKTQ